MNVIFIYFLIQLFLFVAQIRLAMDHFFNKCYRNQADRWDENTLCFYHKGKFKYLFKLIGIILLESN